MDDYYPSINGVNLVMDNCARNFGKYGDIVLCVPYIDKKYIDNFPYKVIRVKFFVLAFAPPFIESYRVILERDACLYACTVPRVIYNKIKPHESSVIVGVRTAQFADKRVQHFESVHLQGLFFDDHLMDPYRVMVEPCSHPESKRSLFGFKCKLVHGEINFLRIEREQFFRLHR